MYKHASIVATSKTMIMISLLIMIPFTTSKIPNIAYNIASRIQRPLLFVSTSPSTKDFFCFGLKFGICGNVGNQAFTKRYYSTANSTIPAMMEILQSFVKLISNIATAMPMAIRLW